MSLYKYSLNKFDKKTINIQSLKKYAIDKLPHNSILRNIIQSEKQHLTIPEFLAKTEIWLKLIESESLK